MHILAAIGLAFGAIVFLVLGVIGVFRDLVVRGPHDAPVVDEEVLGWPARHPDTSTQAVGAGHAAASAWSAERENG